MEISSKQRGASKRVFYRSWKTYTHEREFALSLHANKKYTFSRLRFLLLRLPATRSRDTETLNRCDDRIYRGEDTRYIDREIEGLELPPKRNRELTFLARVRSYECVEEGGEERERERYNKVPRVREITRQSERERTLKILPRIGNGFVWMVSDVGGV